VDEATSGTTGPPLERREDGPGRLNLMLKQMLLAGVALAFTAGAVSAKELNAIGVTLGSLGNPFFVALAKGAEAKAKEINPNVKVTWPRPTTT
jgi:ABC-type sugar transport system substrate-binding protein